MRILIRKPVRHIESYRIAAEQGLMYMRDIEKLYDKLPDIIRQLGHEPVVIETNSRGIYQDKNSIFLAWHSHGTTKNTWFIKESYLPDYFYFDKTGYSGWSELTEDYEYDIDVETIREEVNLFAENYIENDISRFKQVDEAVIPNEPYILAFNQRSDDAVSDFSYIQNFIPKVKEALKSEYKVVVKDHPLIMTWSKEKRTWEWTINDTGSLHDLIAGSSAVYTVNSSAGFESLLHGKRVFTGGQCDYHWATTPIKTEDDLKNSISLIDEPVDSDRITKFLHYCLNHHFMNVNDDVSIARKIIRAVGE